MDFYSSTEIDPLKKFLFPCEIEALTGSNLNNMRKKGGVGGYESISNNLIFSVLS